MTYPGDRNIINSVYLIMYIRRIFDRLSPGRLYFLSVAGQIYFPKRRIQTLMAVETRIFHPFTVPSEILSPLARLYAHRSLLE